MASTTQNIFWKRDKGVTFSFGSHWTKNSTKIHLISTQALPRITLEEMNLLNTRWVATFRCQVLID